MQKGESRERMWDKKRNILDKKEEIELKRICITIEITLKGRWSRFKMERFKDWKSNSK